MSKTPAQTAQSTREATTSQKHTREQNVVTQVKMAIDNPLRALQKKADKSPATQSLQSLQSRATAGSSHVIQREELYFTAAELAQTLVAEKEQNGLDHISDTAIRGYSRQYVGMVGDNEGWVNPDYAKAVATVVSYMKSWDTPASSGFHVAADSYKTVKVKGADYTFYNDSDGFLEFTNPPNISGVQMGPALAAVKDVNIEDNGSGKLKHNKKALGSGSRGQHFQSANIEAGYPGLAASPDSNLTWHHHADRGRMQLIDRHVHAAFSHRGGFSVWGS
ncbi:MAG: HNH endonuclease [Roseobacter sp.]